QPLSGKLVDDECSSHVDALNPVEDLEIEPRDRRKRHDSGRVHQDVDRSELALGSVEQCGGCLLVRDIAPDRQRAPSGLGDGLDDLVGAILVLVVMHDDCDSVRGQARRAGPPDAAGATGHDRDTLAVDSHGRSFRYYMNKMYISVGAAICTRGSYDRLFRSGTMTEESTTRRRGRGRRPAAEVRASVLAATGRLLLREGLPAVTFDRVAKEAGASKVTLYKWWPSPGALAAEAYFAQSAPVLEFPDTGDIRADLVSQLTAFVRWLTRD